MVRRRLAGPVPSQPDLRRRQLLLLLPPLSMGIQRQEILSAQAYGHVEGNWSIYQNAFELHVGTGLLANFSPYAIICTGDNQAAH